MATRKTLKSDRLLTAVESCRKVVVVAHDNPDPDAIASGWAVHFLLTRCTRKRPHLLAGGAVTRAENRQFIRSLDPPLELVRALTFDEPTGGVLVDCSADADNYQSFAGKFEVIGVIDHHQPISETKLRFHDVRPKVAACSSIAASYLREQSLEPPGDLATALLYGIRTETQGSEFRHSRLDRSMIRWLTEFADPEELALIENAPLERHYYSDLSLALQNTLVYNGAALCILPQTHSVEIVGEVADLLIRDGQLDYVMCAGAMESDVVVSVRTNPQGPNAARLVRKTLNGLGGAGGHQHRAGGKITGGARNSRIKDAMAEDLRRRWLSACGVKINRGSLLVRRGKTTKRRPMAGTTRKR